MIFFKFLLCCANQSTCILFYCFPSRFLASMHLFKSLVFLAFMLIALFYYFSLSIFNLQYFMGGLPDWELSLVCRWGCCPTDGFGPGGWRALQVKCIHL